MSAESRSDQDNKIRTESPEDMELEYYIQFPTPKDQNLNSSSSEALQQDDRIWPVPTLAKSGNPVDKDIVVILLGWAGAEHKYLSKYADYYLKRGCIVLSYITPLRYHFIETRKLPNLAEKIVKLLKDLQLDAHSTFFHVFSNGGAFTYSYIIRELARTQDSFQMDVKGTIFDSAPSPRSMQTCFKALVSIFSNLKIYVIAAFVIFLLVCQVVWYHVKNAVTFCIFGDSLDSLESDGKSEATPLTNWLGRIAKIRNHRFLFLYSDGDELIPIDKVERFASIVAAHGNDVEKVKFEGSEHVMHFRRYPKEYDRAVTEFIRLTMKESKGKTIWDNE